MRPAPRDGGDGDEDGRMVRTEKRAKEGRDKGTGMGDEGRKEREKERFDDRLTAAQNEAMKIVRNADGRYRVARAG